MAVLDRSAGCVVPFQLMERAIRDKLTRVLLQKWIPFIALALALACTVFIWKSLSRMEAEDLSSLVSIKTSALREHTRDHLEARLLELKRLGKRWQEAGGPDLPYWKRDAGLLLESDPLLKEIIWAGADFGVRSPATAVKAAIDLRRDGPARAAFIAARDSGKTVMSAPIKADSGAFFLMTVPVYSGAEFRGVLMGLFESNAFLEEVFSESLRLGLYSMAVSSGDQYLYRSTQSAKGEWAQSVPLDFEGARWNIAVWPNERLVSSELSPMPDIVAVFGVFSSILLAVLAHFVQSWVKRGKGLETANAMLSAEIRERTRTEDDLKRTDEKFRSLVETTSDWIWEVDENTRYTYVSPQVTNVLGFSPEEVIGKSPWDFMPAGQSETVKKALVSLTAAREPFSLFESPRLKKDGSIVTMETSGSPVFDSKGGFKGYRGIARDITRRKINEEALRRNKENLKNAQRIAHVGSWDWDIVNDELAWSDEIYRIFEVEPEHFGATYEAFLGFVHPEDRMLVHRSITEALTLGRPYSIEHRIVLPDGSEKMVHEQGEVAFGPDGKALSMAGTVQDITERKQLDEQLRLYREHLKELVDERTRELKEVNERLRFEIEIRKKAEEAVSKMNEAAEARAAELERVNKELEAFTYSASHDLQEPLRVVSGYVQLLGRRYRGKLDKDADEFISFASDGVSRMQRLITDLLSYSRVGKRNAFSRVDCSEAVKRAVANLKVAVDESGAAIECGPMPLIMADEMQIDQLFTNLLSNAVKYKGSVKPFIRVSASGAGNEWIFSVTDNGIGIDPKYSEKIFELFQRLHGKTEYQGTGIGLAICKKVVENHGGRIWVESLPGAGSTFYFTIPKQEIIADA